MHIISREPFNHAAKQYPNEAAALDAVYKTLRRGSFNTPDDLKALFPSLDRMKYRAKWWVIDIGGNNLRMLFFASFDTQKIFVKHIVCHAEYDKLMQLYQRNQE
ncbi:type II toxin-antitoxin system HigB family toxin [Serratia entomophila]|uniref:type II toxin-antitoxin system HigB family toxin n=1 Tax=Serratia entomophila TaxID=42906 RepID=UPI0021784E7C|nr:type II toxin-antitoxin system HigB family toxin [Serratia entomophila]CAI1024401.1 mRNA interferase HigB [Serratia entomophila]CAI1860742.1 mRNA interferase HigB [Serratia entomophila]